MSFEVLREAEICYTTLSEGDGYMRCSRCKCAYYKSAEEQKMNWKIHKTVCKEPEVERISTMGGRECMDELKKSLLPPKPNSAALMARLQDLMREDDKASQYGVELYQFLSSVGSSSSNTTTDTLDVFYRTLWAVPGMPQFLLKSNLRGNQISKLMREYPEGPPQEELPQINDESGECRSIFVVDTLVRTILWGRAPATVRQTPHSNAALLRLSEILGDLTMRDGLQNLAQTVVLTFHRVCEVNKDIPVPCLNANLIPALVDLSSHFPEALEILETLCGGKSITQLSEAAALSAVRCLAVPPITGPTKEPEKIVAASRKLLTVIIKTKPSVISESPNLKQKWGETPMQIAESKMTLRFLHKELSGTPDASKIEETLTKWTQLQDTVWELEPLASEVMTKTELENWKEGAEEFKSFCQQRAA
eukprot:TRINITY_DN36808_c0_g1_i1.p1 TRINITY_DN36808_c0_g1~~TRINITY_DN36808_c0_g1_i1.p1  ORF type:complete len:421 (+),score=80.29 TRINITY_DN36808_c0_g1_i1:51-1313(+)